MDKPPHKQPPKASFLDFFSLTAQSQPSLLLKLVEKRGDVVRVKGFKRDYYLISNPEDIQRILSTHQSNYTKAHPMHDRLGKMLGKGLLTNMGEPWLKRRRLIQPLFHQEFMRLLSEHTVSLTDDMLNCWEAYAKYGTPFNLMTEMMSLVLRITLKSLFNETLSHSKVLPLVRNFTLAQRSSCKALSLKPWFPSTNNLLYHYSRGKIVRFAKDMIKRHGDFSIKNSGLIELLLHAQANGEPVTESDIIDEVITFMATGHETTGNGLGWMWYSLGQHPEKMFQLTEEVDHILGQGLPTYDHLNELTTTRMVFQESLRLHPPIWIFSRTAVEDDIIQGYRIPKGGQVIICPYVVHRLSRLWENPNEFIPERFTEKLTDKFSFIPFSGGPHVCIAHTFSMVKAQLITAMMAQRYELELLPESDKMPYEPLISLRPKKPLRFRIHRR